VIYRTFLASKRVRSEVSQEKVLKTLGSLGLTLLDAKVYILLAKRGPIKARDAAKALKISKQRLYPIIKNLQSKGIVNSSLERPARFSAVEFEKVLDLFLKAKMEQAQHIRQNMDELLSDWKSIAIAKSDSAPDKFTVIEGRSYVYSKILQMIQDTREKLFFVATVPGLARADLFGLFDAIYNHPLKSKIRFRFLTKFSDQNADAMKCLLDKIPKADFDIKGKVPDSGLRLCPMMVIKDEVEVLFFLGPKEGELEIEYDEVCLWTNCKSLVSGFSVMFEDLWRNASDIEKKIIEIEMGKPTPKGHFISDTRTAYEKYHEALQSAKEEIIITTSAKGLADYWKSIDLVKKCVERGVSIKIMAPIAGRNVEAAQQLMKFCEVRNVFSGCQETTIIDGKYLFQFENPPSEEERQEKPETNTYFGNTFHTTDHEYVEKTKKMLNNNWKTGYLPSAAPPELTKLRKLAKMKESVVDPFSDRESIREPERIVGLTRVRMTLNRKVKMTVDDKVNDAATHVLTQGITWNVELAIEDGPTLTGKAICQREMVRVPQKHRENLILRDYYEISFPEGGGFEGNALIICANFTEEKLWEKAKVYALFKGTGAFEGQTINIAPPWKKNITYPYVWIGYLLKPQQ
jgi:sugar-specific transcriptional regulator TrmB